MNIPSSHLLNVINLRLFFGSPLPHHDTVATLLHRSMHRFPQFLMNDRFMLITLRPLSPAASFCLPPVPPPSLLQYRFRSDYPLPRYSFGTLISSLYLLVHCAITFKRTYTPILIPTLPISFRVICQILLSLVFPFARVTYLSCRRFFLSIIASFVETPSLLFSFRVHVITPDNPRTLPTINLTYNVPFHQLLHKNTDAHSNFPF